MTIADDRHGFRRGRVRIERVYAALDSVTPGAAGSCGRHLTWGSRISSPLS
jgi:hypothetical protein